LLQLPSTLLLEHSWSMVEQTTCHRPELRPTMEVIHGQLMQWPESHQALINSGISLARPVPQGRERVVTFWQEIRQLRQALQSQHLPQVQQQQSQQRQRLRPQLPPILEEQQQISGTPTRLSIQGFAETPLETMMMNASHEHRRSLESQDTRFALLQVTRNGPYFRCSAADVAEPHVSTF